MSKSAPQQVSSDGLKFICAREALVTSAYPDGMRGDQQLYSLGFGSQTPPPKEGDTITAEEAFKRLRADVSSREMAVNNALLGPVSQPQFDALFSLYYQGGSDGLKDVAAFFNVGKPMEAMKQFIFWNVNAAGVVKDGLTARRIREMIMALDGYYGDLSQYPFFDGDPHKVTKQWAPFPEGI